MSLTGWSLPQTATGKSSLIAPPPWHFSGDLIAVEFTTDPSAAQSLMPEGLTALPDGSATFVFADWDSTADSDPRIALDPAISQYKEALCILYAKHEGETVARVPYIWVSTDVSLVRGLIQGFPKKQGEIYMTRPRDVGHAATKREPGSVFGAHVSSKGRRLASASVTLESASELEMPTYMMSPMIGTRLWPSFGEDPSVHEFQRGEVGGAEWGKIHSGTAKLEFGESDFEELNHLPILKTGRGHVHSFAFSILGGKTWKV